MEKNQESVDVLVATYNTKSEFLKIQLDSIMNQTYKNIKIIISDDKSTNKEVTQVLEEYKNKDERIEIYIQNENLGYTKNFEFLLSKSSAPYIMFCDHDDLWYEEKIEKSLEKLKKEKVDLVYCNARQIDENGKILKENYFKYKNMPLIKKTGKLAVSRCVGIGCSQMFTKDIKEKMLPYAKEVIAHDWLAAFIANENKGISYIKEPLFGYRLHSSNVFGGRSLDQNLHRWKEKNGITYKSFLNYRKKVISDAYLDGAIMCLKYSKNEKNKKFLEKIIKYYENIEKSKIINFRIISYFKFLAGKNLLKKMIKEIVIFHFPIIAYIKFKI